MGGAAYQLTPHSILTCPVNSLATTAFPLRKKGEEIVAILPFYPLSAGGERVAHEVPRGESNLHLLKPEPIIGRAKRGSHCFIFTLFASQRAATSDGLAGVSQLALHQVYTCRP